MGFSKTLRAVVVFDFYIDLVLEDSALYRSSDEFAVVDRADNNFLGGIGPDFLQHFTVEEDTHVKVTTCLEVYEDSSQLLLRDTYVRVYKIRDEDARLVLMAENDDCEFCSLRSPGIANPTQSMVDVVLERGAYLMHVEAGAAAQGASGGFRYAILAAGWRWPLCARVCVIISAFVGTAAFQKVDARQSRGTLFQEGLCR